MKVKMKKLVMVLLCICVWAMNFAALGKCEGIDLARKEYEEGDFKYRIIDGVEGREPYISITGLTEEGQTKEVLVVPETIKGYPVTQLDKATPYWGDIAYWESENLKTLYLYKNVYVNTDFFCSNLKGVFMLNVFMERGISIGNKVSKIYVSSIQYFECYDKTPHIVFPSNISYRYNYDNAPNYGYYWLDNLNDGEKITYIPEEPTREGYKFGGWYHEPECITAWDFENDTATVYEYEEYTQETFYENVLYAKWLEI